MIGKFIGNRVAKKLFGSYQKEKEWIFARFFDLAIEKGVGKDEAALVAALASNLLTLQLHDPEELKLISMHGQQVAEDLSSDAVLESEFCSHAAEATWWLSQLRLLQGTAPSPNSVTKHRVKKEAYDEAQRLIHRSVELDPQAKYYATMAKTYLNGLEFPNALSAAGEALSREPQNADARKLKAAAEDFMKRGK